MGHTAQNRHDLPETQTVAELEFDLYEWCAAARADESLTKATRQHVGTVASMLMSPDSGEVWMWNDDTHPNANLPFTELWMEEKIYDRWDVLPEGQSLATVMQALRELVAFGYLNLFCFAALPRERVRFELTDGPCRMSRLKVVEAPVVRERERAKEARELEALEEVERVLLGGMVGPTDKIEAVRQLLAELEAEEARAVNARKEDVANGGA